jgi:hypothetical protein
LVQWVASHPEGKTAREHFTQEQMGIFLADRVAGGDSEEWLKLGIMVDRVPENKVIEALSDGAILDVIDGDMFFLGDVMQAHGRGDVKRYLNKRDNYRREMDAECPLKWKFATVRLATDMWCNRSASMSKRGHDIRIAFDKLWTGENAAKEIGGPPLQCLLCGGPETQRHIICECAHADMVKVRSKWRGVIVSRLRDMQLTEEAGLAELMELMFELAYGHGKRRTIFTGMFDPDILELLYEGWGHIYLNDMRYRKYVKGMRRGCGFI